MKKLKYNVAEHNGHCLEMYSYCNKLNKTVQLSQGGG